MNTYTFPFAAALANYFSRHNGNHAYPYCDYFENVETYPASWTPTHRAEGIAA